MPRIKIQGARPEHEFYGRGFGTQSSSMIKTKSCKAEEKRRNRTRRTQRHTRDTYTTSSIGVPHCIYIDPEKRLRTATFDIIFSIILNSILLLVKLFFHSGTSIPLSGTKSNALAYGEFRLLHVSPETQRHNHNKSRSLTRNLAAKGTS